jgi:hypothetical protein
MSFRSSPHYYKFTQTPYFQSRTAEFKRIQNAYKHKKNQENKTIHVNLLNERLLVFALEQMKELEKQAMAYVEQQEQAEFLTEWHSQSETLERQKDRKRKANDQPLKVVLKRHKSIYERKDFNQLNTFYIIQENDEENDEENDDIYDEELENEDIWDEELENEDIYDEELENGDIWDEELENEDIWDEEENEDLFNDDLELLFQLEELC